MQKKVYTNAEISFVKFAEEEVITASTEVTPQEPNLGPDDLPIH